MSCYRVSSTNRQSKYIGVCKTPKEINGEQQFGIKIRLNKLELLIQKKKLIRQELNLNRRIL